MFNLKQSELKAASLGIFAVLDCNFDIEGNVYNTPDSANFSMTAAFH